MDSSEYVCSSSSGESVTDSSDMNNSLMEEVLEEDGESEMILVPRRYVSLSIISHIDMTQILL